MPLTDYVNALQRLRTDSGAAKYPASTLHRAPHKPLLLLSVLDLAARGELSTNFVSLSIGLTSEWWLIRKSGETKVRGEDAVAQVVRFAFWKDGWLVIYADDAQIRSLTGVMALIPRECLIVRLIYVPLRPNLESNRVKQSDQATDKWFGKGLSRYTSHTVCPTLAISSTGGSYSSLAGTGCTNSYSIQSYFHP